MFNSEIRVKIKRNRLHHYEVAREIGISEATFCRWLREEMNEDRKNIVSSAIEKVLRGEHNE